MHQQSFMDTFMTIGEQNYDDEESLLTSKLNKTRTLLNESTLQFQPLNKSSFNTTFASTISHVQPSKQITKSGIYTEFKLKTNDYIENGLDLDELLRAYQQICSDQSNFLSKSAQPLKLLKSNDYETSEQDDLEKESQLWHLLRDLFMDNEAKKLDKNDDNYQMESDYMNGDDDDDEHFVFKNESKLADKLCQNNVLLRRLKIIINWLETNARKNLKLVENKIKSFPEKCTSWEHTLHQLKSQHKTQSQYTREYVRELDPDAPLREKRALHDLDQEDEFLLMEYIFNYVRGGDLDSALKLASKIGHSWRSATLEGFKLFNDPSYLHLNNGKNIDSTEGNMHRDVWRFVVHKMMNNDTIGLYEKAVYGSLAGFVRPVLPACKSFYDYIWVYFKALYNQLMEKELRFNINYCEYEKTGLIGIDDAVPQSAIQIFDELRTLSASSTNKQLRMEMDKPYAIILRHIILLGIDGFKHGTGDLLEFVKQIIINENVSSGAFLRFGAHLALFYRFTQLQFYNDVFNDIIDSYVKFLIDNKYNDLVAFYLSNLPPNQQIKCYSKFLQTITDNDERVKLLKIAKSVNMNVQAVTLNIVENLSRTTNEEDNETTIADLSTTVLNKTSDVITFRSIKTLNEEDHKKITALDWILEEKSQRVKLIEHANTIMRYFLLIKQNIEAVELVLTKVPKDSLDVILSQFKCTDEANLPSNVKNIIKEYLCFKEYVEAISCFNEWFIFFNEKPINKLEKERQTVAGSSSVSFTDRIQLDYQQKQYEDEYFKWKTKALKYCEKTKQKFFTVLTFPNGGWMRNNIENNMFDNSNNDNDDNMDVNIDNNQDDNQEEKQRKKEMDALRKVYLPYVCFVLCEMLSKMELNKELIKVSDLLANELYRLYELFDKSQLKCILNKFTSASIQLLEANYDYMGY